ncbi:MAG: DUF115 domain-containing protein [Spirochaetaceae bacterium]|nr:DUF115 domain-containing protein [Spirochaetaceae bacterium]
MTENAGQTADFPRKIAARRGFSVLYCGKTLLSRIDPVAAAERLINAHLPLKERTLYFCPSPLLGYGLDRLASALPDNSALLCIETDKLLYELSCQHINRSLVQQHNVLIAYSTESASVLRSVRKKWGQRQFRRLEELNLGGGRALAAAWYDDCANALRRIIALEWGNAMTLSRLGRLYIRNFFRNLSLLAQSPPLETLDLGERPVLVAGAGASLDPLLDSLIASGKPLPAIVAVDTALAPLQARGIRPDLVVVLEAQHWNLADFCGWGGETLPIVMDLSALHAQAEFAAGQPRFFWTAWTPLRLFTRLAATGLLPPELPPLGSVGLCATALALRLGKGPVTVAGIDFSYTLDSYHTRGSPSHRTLLRQTNRFYGLYYVQTIFRTGSAAVHSKSGGMVRSDPALRRYLALFRDEFGGRVMEIHGTGLDLGCHKLNIAEAVALLGEAPRLVKKSVLTPIPPVPQPESHLRLSAFFEKERAMLNEIRGILTGRQNAPEERLEWLINEADYLWAHFPDCAGAGGRRPPVSDTGFLKRLRSELDPFITLIDSCLSSI